MSSVPAAWQADPTGRHQLRYWDGEAWTEHVADDGVQGVDELGGTYAPPAGDLPAPAPAASPGLPSGARRTNNPKAVAALVLGIVGMFLLPIICSTLAIVFGALGMRDVNRDPSLGGRGMSIAGLVTGIIGLTFGIGFLIYYLNR